MLFLGESDHRRFPLMSLQFAVHCSPFAVDGSVVGRIPISELRAHGTADMSRQREPRTANRELRTVNS